MPPITQVARWREILNSSPRRMPRKVGLLAPVLVGASTAGAARVEFMWMLHLFLSFSARRSRPCGLGMKGALARRVGDCLPYRRACGNVRLWSEDDTHVLTARVSRSQRFTRSEEHTSELQSHSDLVCRLLLATK